MTVYFCSQARLAASRASTLVIDAFAKNTIYAFSFPTYTRSRFVFRLRSSLVSTACRSRLPLVSSNNKRVWNTRSPRRNAHVIYYGGPVVQFSGFRFPASVSSLTPNQFLVSSFQLPVSSLTPNQFLVSSF